jgi:hypothetical protein
MISWSLTFRFCELLTEITRSGSGTPHAVVLSTAVNSTKPAETLNIFYLFYDYEKANHLPDSEHGSAVKSTVHSEKKFVPRNGYQGGLTRVSWAKKSGAVGGPGLFSANSAVTARSMQHRQSRMRFAGWNPQYRGSGF